MWKEVTMVCFKVLWPYLSGGTQEIFSQPMGQESNLGPLKYEAEVTFGDLDRFHLMSQNNTIHATIAE
jgi:hypothetical protein